MKRRDDVLGLVSIIFLFLAALLLLTGCPAPTEPLDRDCPLTDTLDMRDTQGESAGTVMIGICSG